MEGPTTRKRLQSNTRTCLMAVGLMLVGLAYVGGSHNLSRWFKQPPQPNMEEDQVQELQQQVKKLLQQLQLQKTTSSAADQQLQKQIQELQQQLQLLNETTSSTVASGSSADQAFSKLDLFLSTFPGNSSSDIVNGFTEVQSTLVRSLEFFWPHPKLTVVLDDTVYHVEQERKNRTAQVQSLFADPSQVQVVYNPRSNATLYGSGWFMQQLIMFWADNFTQAEYIGFVDDDTIFTRSVHPLDLFDDRGRPRVIARSSKACPAKAWTEATQYAFQRDPLIYSMTYFPVIVHRRHLKEMREAILRTHPDFDCFDHFFTALIHRQPQGGRKENGISQFYMMMDFVFRHHRDEYSWHLEEANTQWLPKDIPNQQELIQPFPRVSIHGSYLFQGVQKLRRLRTKAGRRQVLSDILREGYCFSLPHWSTSFGCEGNGGLSNMTRPG